MFKLLSLDQFLCADEKHEWAVGRSQHTVDLVDADVAVLCRLLGGQCHFQMDRNGAGAICHVKTPFLGLSAEQTSRPFQIVGSGAFAEVLPVEANRDADFQDAAVIQIGSLLHNGKRSVGRDDHGLACQQPLVNHIEYALLDKAGAASRPQVVQYEKIGTHKRFRVMVAVRAEAALHTVDHVGHSHKEDGLQTVNQSVGNTPDDLRAIIAGTKAHTPKKKRVMDAPAKPSGSLLIDIQAKLQEGKGAGYARWAKNFNLKQLSQTLIYLEENNLLDRCVLEERTAAVTAQYHTLSTKMKSAEQRMAEIKVLQQHIINYAKTRDTYVAYRKAGYSKKFLSEHESEIILHKAAKQFFDEQGLKKLPTVKSLQAEYAQLLSEKKAMYAEYQQARDDMRSLQTAKANVDRILGDNSLTVARESEKDGR